MLAQIMLMEIIEEDEETIENAYDESDNDSHEVSKNKSICRINTTVYITIAFYENPN